MILGSSVLAANAADEELIINVANDLHYETEEGKSIESILAGYNVSIPGSKYYDMLEVAVTVYESHVAGDENMPAYSNEVVIASKGIGALLIYALSEITAEEYAQVLTFVCKLIGADIPENFIRYAGDQIDRFEGIELVVSTAILPLILKLVADDAPVDCDVTLPGYADLIQAKTKKSYIPGKCSGFLH